MVHRILGPASVAGIAAVGVALASPAVSAFCRTTTCAIPKPPAECQRDTNGCFTAGIPLAWEQQCVSFSVNQAGSPKLGLNYDAALSLAQKGFSAWPSTSCSDGFPSIAIMSLGPLVCDNREYNVSGPNANAILFRDQGWTHDPQAIALTTVVFNSKTGKILDADMEINSEGFDLNQFDLDYVFTHESGHFFGLDHSSDPNAVMYFQYSLGNSKETNLTPDDIAAICTAYPSARMTPACDFEPEKGFAADCGGDVKASCAVAPARRSRLGTGAAAAGLLLAGALLHRWRARRGRRAIR
jgi:hypothetical protein